MITAESPLRWQDRGKLGDLLRARGWARNRTKRHHFAARNPYSWNGYSVFLWEHRGLELFIDDYTEGGAHYQHLVTAIPVFSGREWREKTVEVIEAAMKSHREETCSTP